MQCTPGYCCRHLCQQWLQKLPLQEADYNMQQSMGCRVLTVSLGTCRESVAINSSLMTLARCLEVLRYNQQHPADQKVIPYRESKVGDHNAALCSSAAQQPDWSQQYASCMTTSDMWSCILDMQITHLFKGVLHGHGRFVMVVNVSPASEAFNETKRVLQVS